MPVNPEIISDQHTARVLNKYGLLIGGAYVKAARQSINIFDSQSRESKDKLLFFNQTLLHLVLVADAIVQLDERSLGPRDLRWVPAAQLMVREARKRLDIAMPYEGAHIFTEANQSGQKVLYQEMLNDRIFSPGSSYSTATYPQLVAQGMVAVRSPISLNIV
jgi:hypothetical protein